MRWRFFATLTVLTVALAAGCNRSSDSNSPVTRLNGGGATFIDPIMQEWAYAYKNATGVEVDYLPKGSGNGIQQMTNKTIDFGCSDAPMKQEQLELALQNGGEVIHIPLIMGPVGVVYHLPGLEKPLVLSGPVLADIFLGKITKWNDKAIQDLNPGVNLPPMDIAPVYRAEASGTTNIFTEYLSKSSEEFKNIVGISTQPTWPKGVGTGERESSGVATRVKNSPGTISYVEIRFAKINNLQYAAIKNRAGKEILPEPAGVTAAAAAAMQIEQTAPPYSLHELTFSLTDAPGEMSYPISGISYGVIYKKQPANIGKALKEFLTWATHEGQSMAAAQDYAPLPDELVKKIDVRLQQMELVP